MKKIILILLLLVACGPNKQTLELQQRAKSTFGTLPESMPGSENDTPERIALGEKLYFDKRLSINNTQSCNSCHNIEGQAGGVDNQPTSAGALGQLGGRNSPTVLNAGFHTAQFWDGRAKDLQAQEKGPILAAGEMAMPNSAAVITKLKNTGEYEKLFKEAFSDGMTYPNLGEAIAAFERTLITRDRFEDFVKGDVSALSQQEQAGLQTFIASGCAGCHNGATFGGKTFMKVGIVNPYPTNDLGRYNVTKNESDRYVFKVPSLKNVALTAPYFHDGKVASLEEAIEKMAYHQLGVEMPKQDVKNIAAFLNSLTDKKR